MNEAGSSLRYRPGLYQVHNQLGILLARRGNLEAAKASFERALRVKPDYELARANLERLRGTR